MERNGVHEIWTHIKRQWWWMSQWSLPIFPELQYSKSPFAIKLIFSNGDGSYDDDCRPTPIPLKTRKQHQWKLWCPLRQWRSGNLSFNLYKRTVIVTPQTPAVSYNWISTIYAPLRNCPSSSEFASRPIKQQPLDNFWWLQIRQPHRAQSYKSQPQAISEVSSTLLHHHYNHPHFIFS